MFGYYLDLAWRSLRRNKVLTILMVLAIGLGIGASMTMITVLHVMSGDPVPGLSSKLYVPMLDPRSGTPDPDDVPDGFTWPDAINLIRARRADAQAAMAKGVTVVHPPQDGLGAFFSGGQFATSEYFSMFDVPFRAGHGWSARQDQAHARVLVLNGELAHKLFGDARAVGRTVRLNDTDFRVIGVLDDWNPQPAFYRQKGIHLYGSADQIFLPLQTALELHMPMDGHFSCWGNGDESRMSDHCTWVQLWVRLGNPARALAYRHYLEHYWRDQQSHGRFPRKQSPPRLYGLMDWLAHEHVIPDTLSMQMWLAIGFLVVCMLSVVALLLAKFLRRSGEIGVRRALGASRGAVFAQCLVEAGMVGLVGGIGGWLLTLTGLWLVRRQPVEYADLAHQDLGMFGVTFVLAIVASLLAGLLPALRASRVAPALQLKTL